MIVSDTIKAKFLYDTKKLYVRVNSVVVLQSFCVVCRAHDCSLSISSMQMVVH